MRKLTFIFVAILLLFVACNKESNDREVADDQVEIDEVEQNIEEEEQVEKAETEADDSEVEDETTDDANADSGNTSSDNGANGNAESTKEEGNGWEKPEKIENMNHLDMVHLAYDIFAAQDRKDYDFLQSVAAKGTKVDRKKDKFSFENVTYPFEMEFFTKEDLGDLKLRYTHEEDGIVHVGFGAINYDEEYSFVVEFEFVKEGGTWKLLSMDINA